MMKTKRFARLVALILAGVFFAASVLFFVGATKPAEQPVNACAEEQEEETESDLNALVEGFLSRLRAKYGEDYERYYQAILADWGSVEAYLLSLVDEDIPDVAADGWRAFVKWLGEYSPVWGGILAVLCIIVVLAFGKKALGRIKDFVKMVLEKFRTLFTSVNKQYAVLKAQNDALMSLLGENPKFAEKRKALEEANGEIEKDDV